MPAKRDHWLEVGVGTGRFASALGIPEGIDPSPPMLAMAKARGIRTHAGCGEALPFTTGQFDGVLLVVTLCFLADPRAAFRECARAVRDGGQLLVGFVPADSPWGRWYQEKGRQGHPFYAPARFYTAAQVVDLAAAADFRLNSVASCLTTRPEAAGVSLPDDDSIRNAGFVALSFVKAMADVRHTDAVAARH